MESGWIRWILEQAYPDHVRGRLPAGARRGRPEREVRRHHLPGRQHPGRARAGWRRTRRRWRRRRTGRGRGQHPGGVPRHAGLHHGRQDHPAAEEVRRERRHDHRDRRRHVDRRPLRACPSATTWSSGSRTAPSGGWATRSSTSRARSCRSPWTTRTRWRWGIGREGGRLLRQQPDVPPRAGRGAEGREGRRVVRLPDAAAQRVGVGPELPRGRRGGRRGQRRQGQGVPVRARGDVPRPAARHVQVRVQRDLPAGRRRR